MNRIVFSPRAKADIDAIWDQTVQRWDIVQAERYVRQIQAAIERLAAYPQLGIACDFIREGYRKHPTGSHVIFFQIRDGGIATIRLLHARMDLHDAFLP